jgi:two-component system KDP operon response regulator KdpE
VSIMLIQMNDLVRIDRFSPHFDGSAQLHASAKRSLVVAAPVALTILRPNAEPVSLRENLLPLGIGVVSAAGIQEAQTIAAKELPSLVILDLDLESDPGRSLDLLASISSKSRIPVLALSGNTEASFIVDALDAGAHDFIRWPFNVAELAARVRAALRWYWDETIGSRLLIIGNLRIDLGAGQAFLLQKRLKLSSKQFEVLAELARHFGRTVSRDQILRRVWSDDPAGGSKALRLIIFDLRRLLKRSSPLALEIVSTYGVGYCLQMSVSGKIRISQKAAMEYMRPYAESGRTLFLLGRQELDLRDIMSAAEDVSKECSAFCIAETSPNWPGIILQFRPSALARFQSEN